MWKALAVAGVNGLSTYFKSKAEKDALKQQAQIAKQNATLSDIQARDSINQGRNQVEDYQRNLGAFKSSQINALADNGIDVSQGSAIDLLASTEMMGQADIDNLKYNAALQSWGHKVDQTNSLNQANALQSQSKSINPLMSAFFSAGSSMLNSQMKGSGGGFESLSGALGKTKSSDLNAASSLFGADQGASWRNYNWNWINGG